MNRNGVKILVLTLALLVLSGCGGSDSSSVESVTADGMLTVGIINGNDAYTSKSGETYVGIEPTIIENYVAALEIQATYVECATQAEAVAMLDAGEVDVVMGRIGYTSGYGNKYQVTTSYGKSGLYLVNPEGVYVNTLSLYSDLQVGISANVPVQLVSELENISNVVQLTINDMNTVSSMMDTSVIVGAVCTEREAFDILSKGGVQVQEIVGGVRESYVALLNADQAKTAAELNIIINRYLDSLATVTTETETAEG